MALPHGSCFCVVHRWTKSLRVLEGISMVPRKEFSFIIVCFTVRTKLNSMSSSQHSYAKGTLLVNIGYAVTSFYCLQSSLMSLGPWNDVERGTVAIISFKVSRAAFRTSEVNIFCLDFSYNIMKTKPFRLLPFVWFQFEIERKNKISVLWVSM